MANGPPAADLRLYFSAADGGAFKAESVMGTKRFPEREGIQMRRALFALAALATAAFTALTLAVPAGAATTTEVIHFKALTAYATWSTSMATPTGGTSVTLTSVSAGSGLTIYQDTWNYKADGTYLGQTSIYAPGDSWSTFSFSIGPSLERASLRITDLAASIITFDNEGNVTGTDVTTIDAVNVAWTGQGKANRQMTNFQIHQNGYNYTNHTVGTSRPATATGTFGDSALSADQLLDCGMGYYSSGTVTISR